MTLPEYCIIGITAFGAVTGYFKGFLKQISSLAGLLLGYGAAVLFLSPVHIFLIEKGIISPESSTWISFIVTIFSVFLSIRFLTRFIEKIFKSLGLDFTNQFAGMFLGGIKYFLLVIILFCFLEALGFITEENSSVNLIDFISLFKTVLFGYVLV